MRMRKLAKASRPLCNQLLEILQDLKVPGKSRFRKLTSLRQAIRSVRKKKDIKDLEMRLRKIQDEATRRMMYILKYTVHTLYFLVLMFWVRNDHASLHSALAKQANGTRQMG
jgi:hypothetical protein